MHWGRKALVVDNGEGNFELRALGDGALRRAYEVPRKPESRRPLSIGFVNGGQEFIGGSMGPTVFRFKISTGEILQELKHSDVGYTQRIAVSSRMTRHTSYCELTFAQTCEVPGQSIVALGSSSEGLPGSITVWTRKMKSKRVQTKSSSGRTIVFWLAITLIIAGLYWLDRQVSNHSLRAATTAHHCYRTSWSTLRRGLRTTFERCIDGREPTRGRAIAF